MRRPSVTALLLSALVLTGLTGCDQDIFLSGKWSTVSFEDQEAAALGTFMGCKPGLTDCPAYLELSLGHYGEDVVGWFRLWEDEKVAPAQVPCECACQEVNGTYSNDTLVFYLDNCAGDGQLRVELRRQSSTELLGEIASHPLGTNPLTVALEKTHEEGQLTSRDKAECPPCPESSE